MEPTTKAPVKARPNGAPLPAEPLQAPIEALDAVVLPAKLANALLDIGMRTDPGQALLIGFIEGHPDLDSERQYNIQVGDGYIREQPPAQQNGRRR